MELLKDVFWGEIQIDHGGLKIVVSEDALERGHGDPTLGSSDGKRVSEDVRGDGGADPRSIGDTTNGTLDQNAFTDDEAGRIALDMAEHFVIYEVAQQLEEGPGAPPNPTYLPIPIATDPFAGGFGVMTQTKIFNATGTYWQDNPLGLWKIGFIQFTPKADACRSNFVDTDCVFMNTMTANNGIFNSSLRYLFTDCKFPETDFDLTLKMASSITKFNATRPPPMSSLP